MRTCARFAATSVLALAGLLPAAAGECVTVRSTATVVTPDGTPRDAGALELCVRKRLGPTVGVLELSLDGAKIGNFMSRVDQPDAAGVSPFVQFRRLDGGELLVEGFVIRRGTGLESFRMQMKDGRRRHYPDLLLDAATPSADGSFRVAIGGSTPTVEPAVPDPDLVSDAGR